MTAYTYRYPRPALTVDIILLTFGGPGLQTLLIQRAREPFKGQWALPGGFVRMDESLQAAARRELREETSLDHANLEQVKAFGDPDRDPRGRVVTVAYTAIIPSEHIPRGQAGSDAARAGWRPLDDLPRLAFDHAGIIDCAVKRLQDKLRVTPIALQFLTETFTLSRIRRLYQAVLGVDLDEGGIGDRLMSAGLIEPAGNRPLEGERPEKRYRRREAPPGDAHILRLLP
jgi:8-oxo-dGTP diphosphatase